MDLLSNWNVLCWNVRGLNADHKLLALLNVIPSSGCVVICLQENKKNPLLIICSLSLAALKGLINLLIFPLKEPLEVLQPFGTTLFSQERYL